MSMFTLDEFLIVTLCRGYSHGICSIDLSVFYRKTDHFAIIVTCQNKNGFKGHNSSPIGVIVSGITGLIFFSVHNPFSNLGQFQEIYTLSQYIISSLLCHCFKFSFLYH